MNAEMYGGQIGGQHSSARTNKLFLDIRSRVDREIRNMKQMTTLQGSLDLILAASGAADKPERRSEEVLFAEIHKDAATSLTTPSKSVLSLGFCG